MTVTPEDHGTALVRLEGKVDRLGDKLDAQTNAVMQQLTYGDRENATLIATVSARVDAIERAFTLALDNLRESIDTQNEKISNRRWTVVQGIAFPILVLVLLALLKAGLVPK